MSLKTHPSVEYKIVRFDEYKLLYNHIDRLKEFLDRLTTRPQGRGTQQSQPYKPYIHRERDYRQFPSYDSGRGSYRQRSNDRNRGGYSPIRSKSRGYITSWGSYNQQGNYTIEMTVGSRDLEVLPHILPGYPELQQDHPVEIETDIIAAGNLVILPENVMRRTLQQLKYNIGNKHPPKTKTVLKLYCGDPEEDEKEGEEVMAAMCHSSKIYSLTQPNSIDEACSQQLTNKRLNWH